MNPQQALASSVGSKFLIAFTGLSLVLFLAAHLAGNLLFIAGPDAFNHYSHSLISNPLVYGAEAGLLALFVLHLVKAAWMFAANWTARPERYVVRRWARNKNPRSRKTVASTTMILTGTITLLFVITHLVTFKFGPYYETVEGIRDLYRLQLAVFSDPAYVVFYLFCMAVIFFHLWHGISSAAQSLGVDSPHWTPRIIWTARLVTALLAAGFGLLPVFTFALSAN